MEHLKIILASITTGSRNLLIDTVIFARGLMHMLQAQGAI